MARVEVGSGPVIDVRIADVEDLPDNIRKFEWKSFTNGGYIIRARIEDPYWNILRQMALNYLKSGRKEPTEVKWTLSWGDDLKTEERTAYITDLDARGIRAGGSLEFIAVDPPSFLLNAGNADGSFYEGNIQSVIEEVVNRYAPSIVPGLDVGQTDDFKQNQWWMMRQDPKTFIMSLLEWSSSVTQEKTNWIVASRDKELIIKEQARIEGEDFGIFTVNVVTPGADDVRDFEFLADNFLTSFQTKLLTQGISTISEKYLDKVTDDEERFVHVKDTNTSEKKNTQFGPDRGFKRPDDGIKKLNYDTPPKDEKGIMSGGTAIMSIPELNAGDMGIRYENWIDGRARTQFLNMLKLVMRLKIRVDGDVEFDDSTKLGVSTCTIQWFDADGQNFFLSGRWLIYGWHHVATRRDWYTDIFLTRLDHDANAQVV